MNASPSVRHKQIFVLTVKALLVFGLLYFLVKKGFISFQATKNAFTRLDILLPAIAIQITATMIGIIRWHWLLRAQNIQLKFWRTLELGFIGQFFNITIPGAVSGDLIKAFYIGREAPHLRGRSFGTIVFDRIAGLSALTFVSAGAIISGYSQFEGTPMLSALSTVITLAAAGAAAFYIYLFLLQEKHDPLFHFFKALERRSAKLGSLTRIYEGIRYYHSHKWVVLKVLLISVLAHLIVGWICMRFGHALGDADLSLVAAYVVVPLGLLVSAVPLMPAGVGTGHAAFLYLFALVGSERGADIFTLYALTSMIIGAIGGIFYLKFKHELPGGTALANARENA